jgi:hypothetical protein
MNSASKPPIESRPPAPGHRRARRFENQNDSRAHGSGGARHCLRDRDGMAGATLHNGTFVGNFAGVFARTGLSVPDSPHSKATRGLTVHRDRLGRRHHRCSWQIRFRLRCARYRVPVCDRAYRHSKVAACRAPDIILPRTGGVETRRELPQPQPKRHRIGHSERGQGPPLQQVIER